MSTLDGRIRAFDWLKGLAVLVMIQCHALALLRPDLHAGPLFARLTWIDGLVAPSFILTSGFALALVQVRGGASGGRRLRALRSLRRIGEVLLVATWMTSLWFPIFDEPKWLLRMDILPCIGLSLLVALPLFTLVAHRPWMLAATCAACGFAIVLATPVVWGSSTGLAARFFTSTTGSLFPLFPWSGYVFLGGALGSIAASTRLRGLIFAVIALAGLGAALGRCAAELAVRWPRWQWYPAVNHSERVMVASGLILVLLAAEHGAPRTAKRGRVVGFLEVFGSSSLAAYFGHEVMLFKDVFGLCFSRFWGKSAGWITYWALTAALIALTYAFTWCVAYVYERAGRWLGSGISRSPRPRPAGS